MAANILISITQKRSMRPKFENHFPKRIFQWSFVQSRRTWIDVQITLPKESVKKIILFKNGGQNHFGVAQ